MLHTITNSRRCFCCLPTASQVLRGRLRDGASSDLGEAQLASERIAREVGQAVGAEVGADSGEFLCLCCLGRSLPLSWSWSVACAFRQHPVWSFGLVLAGCRQRLRSQAAN